MIATTQSKTRPIGERIGEIARSFFNALGEFLIKMDELPLQDKQPMKEGLIRFLSVAGADRDTISLLTSEDDELSRILAHRGWWILPKDINGPVKRELLRLGREGKADEIDHYLSGLFSANDWTRLTERIETWFKLPFMAARKQVIIDSLEAHKARKWTVAIPTLLPLIDGLVRKFSNKHLGQVKNPNQALHINRFAEFYRKNQPKLFGESFASFVRGQMFARFNLNNEASPSSINRHGILHGETFDYPSEANSLKVFLMLDTIAQFVQTIELRKAVGASK